MSKIGLEQSEKIAKSLDLKIKASLAKQKREIKSQIEKVEFLLGDKDAIKVWKTSAASPERLQHLLAEMDETERLYLEAGDSNAARIFKSRMKSSLQQRLTNLKANELEVKIQAEKFKAKTKNLMLQQLNTVKREGELNEMYQQSKKAGGFLSNFGRAYMKDLVTLETKAAGSKTLGEYMENLYNQNEKGLKDVFVKGIIRGDSYNTMIRNLQKKTKLTVGKANLLVATEANAIFNQSVKDVIHDNPLVKGYRFRAVLDSRTSKICQQHDGEYIPKDQVKPGINFPPLHPRCRSTVTTVLYDENERRDMQQRYTKNGLNQWEKVPKGMTYLEFKDKFGFANSKNPKTYNAAVRNIHDATLARITPNKYKGYVKPSVSATARIQKMVDSYVKNVNNISTKETKQYLDSVMDNTKQDVVAKAMTRQAQAEAGFDGLPLQLDSKSFNEQVKKNNYKVLYRDFGGKEYKDKFLTGDQMYGKGAYKYGAGTYAFSKKPDLKDKQFTEIAIKTKDSKILDLTQSGSLERGSHISIEDAATPDERINIELRKVPMQCRVELFSTLAIEYGYDLVKVRVSFEDPYYVILNRTAAIVKGE